MMKTTKALRTWLSAKCSAKTNNPSEPQVRIELTTARLRIERIAREQSISQETERPDGLRRTRSAPEHSAKRSAKILGALDRVFYAPPHPFWDSNPDLLPARYTLARGCRA